MSDPATESATDSADRTERERAVRERVDRLVSAADDRIESTPDPTVEAPDVEAVAEEFGALADEASDLLASTESNALLSAIGLLDGEEGTEGGPGSIPAAIAHGDTDRVATLRTILTLSTLPGREAVDTEAVSAEGEAAAFDADELGRTLARLRESLAARSAAAAGDAETGGGDGDESAAIGAGEAVRSALQGALSDARDELETLSGAIGSEGSTDDDVGGDGDAGDERGSGGEDDPLDGLGVDESVLEEFDFDPGPLADLDVDVDREGLEAMADAGLSSADLLDADLDLDSLSDLRNLGSDRLEALGADVGDAVHEATGSGGVGPGGRATMLSTMPASDRPDMRAVRRYSTMPKYS